MKSLLVSIFLSLYASAEHTKISNTKVHIVDDRDFILDNSPEVNMLKRYFDFKFSRVPNARDWKLIQQYENICLTMRVKTKDRQSKAYFSYYPSGLNKPPLLVAKKQRHFKAPVDLLQTIKNQAGFRLGIAKSYDYGESLNKVISQIPQSNLMVVSTHQNVEKTLFSLLKLDRVDAVLSSSSTAGNYFNEPSRNHQYDLVNIVGVDEIVYGYFTCSKTTFGLQVINTLNHVIKENRSEYLKLLKDDGWSEDEINILNIKYNELEKPECASLLGNTC